MYQPMPKFLGAAIMGVRSNFSSELGRVKCLNLFKIKLFFLQKTFLTNLVLNLNFAEFYKHDHNKVPDLNIKLANILSYGT